MAAFAAATVATMHWIASRDWGLGLSTALLASILATQLAFAVAMIRTQDILPLGSLLGPYLLIAVGMVVWADTIPGDGTVLTDIGGWLGAHMVAAILSYGFVIGCDRQRRDHPARTGAEAAQTQLFDRPPSIDLDHGEDGNLRIDRGGDRPWPRHSLRDWRGVCSVRFVFQVTHKSLLTLITFAVIGILLWLHLQNGVRGRLRRTCRSDGLSVNFIGLSGRKIRWRRTPFLMRPNLVGSKIILVCRR